MKKVKRVLAWIGIIILVAMYLITLVSAIMATPATKDFFKASILATIIIPILLYVYILIYRWVTGKGSEKDTKLQNELENKQGFHEAFSSKKKDKVNEKES